MVQLSFDARAVVFQSGFRTIRRAYRTSVAAFSEQLRELDENYRALEQDAIDGMLPEPFDGEPDEFELIDYQRATVGEALREIRQAFLVALYHYWERSVVRWTKTKYVANDAYAWLVKAGAHPDEKGLEQLRNIVNCIKHDDGSGLWKLRRELLPGVNTKKAAREVHLALTDDIVEEYFTTVLRSGFQPKPFMLPPLPNTPNLNSDA